jgi:hypothetical protein
VLTAKALGEPRDDVAHAVHSRDREHVVMQACLAASECYLPRPVVAKIKLAIFCG